MSISAASGTPGYTDLQPPPKKNTPWRMAFRIFRWITYIATAITLVMLFHKADPPMVEAASPEAAARAEHKFENAAQALNSGQAATVHLDQMEINSYLSSHLNLKDSNATPAPGPQASSGNNNSVPPNNSSNAPTEEDIERARSSVRVKIQLIEDRVQAYVLFDVHGKDLTLQLEGRLSSTGGYLRFAPVRGEIGSLPIPQSALERAVQRMMDSPVNREALRLPPAISDLHVANGELVITYQ